eukprot:TRINITY_DN6611_c0_g1_i6.p1 TRINITY_DN6611_c0_g1~~TRINITY_DN6611_c0_g1_i6.p1  ORF type:complete len:148 (-),score=17.58 TRINITY_DN6611_c0_g1_i6:128-571(-)
MTRHLLLTRGDEEQEEEEDIEEEEASITRYCLDIMVYEGQRSTLAGETPKAVVRKLLSAYEDKGYHLHYNWYSSVQLFRVMREVGIHCCGTVRKNRRDPPDVSAMEAGSMTYQNKSGLVYLAWSQTRRAPFIYFTCRRSNSFKNTFR